MARSKLSDVNFQSSVFKDTFQGEFYDKLALLNSLMVRSPEDYIPSNTKGYTDTLPKWNEMSGDLKQIVTGLSTTYNLLADYVDIAVWVEREVAFQAEDILLTVAGQDKDVTKEVARQAGEFFAKKVHGLGASVLTGIFTTTLASTHVKDDSGVVINNNGLVDAKLKLGDNGDDLSDLCVHSKVAGDMVKDRIADYKANPSEEAYTTGRLTTVTGLRVSQSDLFTPTGQVYNSYLGRPGSLIYQFRDKPIASFSNANIINLGNIFLELVRDAETAGGIDGMIFRFSGAFHAPGVQWNGTVASNPTDAQLQTGANWTKVAPNKGIKLVQYKSL